MGGYGMGAGSSGMGMRGPEPRPGDWDCPRCTNMNFSSRDVCNGKMDGEPCNLRKPDFDTYGAPHIRNKDSGNQGTGIVSGAATSTSRSELLATSVTCQRRTPLATVSGRPWVVINKPVLWCWCVVSMLWLSLLVVRESLMPYTVVLCTNW